MSKAAERRMEQERYLAPDPANERPVHQATAFDPDPESWESVCAGNRSRLHIKGRVLEDGRWRCASCWQSLRPRKTNT